MVVDAHIKKEERSQSNNLTLQHGKLEKKNKLYTIVEESK